MTKKEKRPLSFGDRVRVYDGPLNLIGAKGTVDSVCGHNDLYHVKLDCSTPEADTPLIHRRQCVRLKPKPKVGVEARARERVEISGETNGSVFYVRTCSYGATRMRQQLRPIDTGPGRQMFLTEIRPGEVPLSREALERFMDEFDIPRSSLFRMNIFRRLGFTEEGKNDLPHLHW